MKHRAKNFFWWIFPLLSFSVFLFLFVSWQVPSSSEGGGTLVDHSEAAAHVADSVDRVASIEKEETPPEVIASSKKANEIRNPQMEEVVYSSVTEQPREFSHPQPQWQIPAGGEFWREKSPALRPGSSVSGIPHVPLRNLSSIVERKSHAFQSEETGEWSAKSRGYDVEMSPGGWTYSLKIPQAKQTEADEYMPEPEFRVGSRRIEIGGQTVWAEDTKWTAEANTLQQEVAPGLLEHVFAGERGVEVAWLLREQPMKGEGVRIHVETEGLEYHGASRAGGVYLDAQGRKVLRITNAVAVDAEGIRVPLHTDFSDRGFQVDIPADLLAQLSYPLAIDPVISPQLIIDMETENMSSIIEGARDDQPFADLNGYLYFFATDGTTKGLWRTDGSLGGTTLFMEGVIADNLTVVGGNLFYFTRSSVYSSSEINLWVTDGSEEGTSLLKSFIYWQGFENPELMNRVGNKVIFRVKSADHGLEPWISDGTPQGTMLLKDIRPGVGGSSPSDFTPAGQQTFFIAQDGTHGAELWVTDGTGIGTNLVQDINPGAADSVDKYLSEFLCAFGNKVIFSADDGVHNHQLWISGGTNATTHLLKDVSGLTQDSSIQRLTNAGSQVFFTALTAGAGTELWRTDGTETGTYMVKDIMGGGFTSHPENLVATGGHVLFSAEHPEYGADRIWRSDGTESGTYLVDFSDYGVQDQGISFGNGVMPFGEEFLIPYNKFLYRYNPVTDTVSRIYSDNYTFTWSPQDKEYYVSDGRVFFHAGTKWGEELFVTNGEAFGGTTRLELNWRNASSLAGDLIVVGDEVFFKYGDNELWKTDGTEAGTIELEVHEGGRNTCSSLPILDLRISAHGGLYYEEVEWCGSSKWRGLYYSNGQPGESQLVMSDAGEIESLDLYEDSLYVTIVEDATPDTLDIWAIGPETSQHVGSVSSDRSFYNDSVVQEGTLFMSLTTEEYGQELMKVVEPGLAPVLVKDIFPGPGHSYISGLTKGAGGVFFKAWDGEGYGLWYSDGTLQGTVKLRSISPSYLLGVNQADPEMGSYVFFRANHGLYGEELWTSDGTIAGTRMLIDLLPGANSSRPIPLSIHNGWVYFSALTESGNRELYVSDGTAAGTIHLAAVDPEMFIDTNNFLFFIGDDGVHGAELWRTNGDPAHTEMVVDLYAGPTSGVSNMVRTPDSLIFIGNTYDYGSELVKLPLKHPALRLSGRQDTEIDFTGNIPQTGDGTHFGTIPLGGYNVLRSFMMENISSSPLNISVLSMSGDTGDFNVNGLPVELSPGATLPFEVQFTPSQIGVRTTTILIRIGGYRYFTIHLEGIGCSDCPPPVTPNIVVQQGSQDIYPGSTATFKVDVSGSEPLTYEWFLGLSGDTSQPLTGSSGSQYSSPLLSDGTYRVWFRSSNDFGTTDSPTMTATVQHPPVIQGLADSQSTAGDLFLLNASSTESAVTFGLVDAPAWLNINPNTGRIFGTPDSTGIHPVTVSVSNAFYQDVQQSFELTVVNAPPVLTGLGSLPSARVGQSFAFGLSATGENLTFAVDGLPNGLTFDPATRLISGTPSEEGLFQLLVQVSNDGGAAAQSPDLRVFPAYQPPRLTSAGSVNVATGGSISFSFSATDNPDSFEVESIPAWLTLNPATGVLTGTAPLPGTETVRVRASGPGGTGEWFDFQIHILPPPGAPQVTSLARALGRVGEPFSFQLTSDSELSPVTWSASSLPPGITLDTATGILSGMPTAKGDFPVDIRAYNNAGVSNPQELGIEILRKLNVPVLQSDPTLEASLGVSFSFEFTASHSPDSFVFTGLPDWLLQTGTSGLIAGTPDETGDVAVDVVAVNADGESRPLTVTLSVRVAPGAPSLVEVSNTIGMVGQGFSAELITDPAADIIQAEDLPPGITLDEVEGVLGGRPSDSGTFTTRFTPANSEGYGETVEVTFQFDPLPAAPQIPEQLIPPGRIQEPYTHTLTVNGDSISAWQVEGLPPGVEVDPQTGVLSGTPDIFGRFTLTVSASNVTGRGNPRELEWIVRPLAQAPRIMGSSFVVAQQGQEMTYEFSAEPDPIVSYKAEGLPRGITLDPIQGRLIGKPVDPGTYTVSLTAENLYGTSEPLPLQLIVEPEPTAPKILTQRFQVFGQPFVDNRLQLTASGFPSSPMPDGFKFEAKEDLPSGLRLNSATGELYGSLDEGEYEVIVRASRPELTGPWRSIILLVRPESSANTITGPKLVTVNLWESTEITLMGNLGGLNRFQYYSPLADSFKTYSSVKNTFHPTVPFLLPGSNGITVRGFKREYIPQYCHNWSDGGYHCHWPYYRNSNYTSYSAIVMQVNLASDIPRITVASSLSGTSDNLPVMDVQATVALHRVWVWYRRIGDTHYRSNWYGSPGSPINISPGAYDAIVYGEMEDGTKTEPKQTVITIANTANAVTVTELVPGVDTGIASLRFAPVAMRSGSFTKKATRDSTPSLEVQVGVAFNASLSLSGMAERVEVEGLPEGLSVNPLAFTLGGIPQEPGVFPLTFTVWTEDGVPGVSYLDLLVNPADGTPEFTGTNPPAAQVGETWTWTPTFTPSLAEVVIQEAPAWVELDSETGTLSGTPILPGEENLVIQAFNEAGWGRRLEWTLDVEPSALAQNAIEPETRQLVGGEAASHPSPVSSFGTYLELDGRVPGLVWDPETGTFSGTPEGKGAQTLRVRAWNEHGPGAWVDWQLEVLESAENALTEFVDDAGLVGEDALPGAIPHADGVANILKFAHNMDPSQADKHRLAPGTGDSGLPVIFAESQPNGDQVAFLEYIRRRFSTLSYHLQLKENLMDPDWVSPAIEEDITVIDNDWERVKVRPAGDIGDAFYIKVGVSTP